MNDVELLRSSLVMVKAIRRIGNQIRVSQCSSHPKIRECNVPLIQDLDRNANGKLVEIPRVVKIRNPREIQFFGAPITSDLSKHWEGTRIDDVKR